jgi:hypothetical protein
MTPLRFSASFASSALNLFPVRLHTTNALTWVIEFDPMDGPDFANDPLVFGERVTSGGNPPTTPSFGESTLAVKLINPAPGDPLPDLIQLVSDPEPGQEVVALSFYGRADGFLPDGSQGRAQTVQTGLFMTSFQGATADGFPAEKVSVLGIGP